MFGIQLPVDIDTIHITRPNLYIDYPKIVRLGNIQVQQMINDDIMKSVDKMIKEQGYFQNPNTTMWGSYEVKTNERAVLSINLINDAYSGGAHGLTVMQGLTYDINTGTMYQLKDLFKPNSNYQRILSDIVRKQIKDRNIFVLGSFIGIKSNQDFYIADKALVLYFQLYELTSYAFGFPSFPISVYEIEDIIDQQSPLGKMIHL
ncbi:peptidoglycan-N-acetylmuramic acid deacetylase PdaC [Clostridium homopropionicum DSM 5847]|uniref:Peptidoglycan-N-acetylmuramic acid deacetylase PdaC n=1 Tax=Clostridium homopropionicum DSM 5847 TaxID=1121318 RepID=A0A0L6Z773_9CLOT|nr:DUF3298 and DUF4163 domain-containing protein [Clostridium homopropionicum]KOA18804.1 peptidoglycan-N-acetylmuramic acid deacetylase PdaC [Clostridium homopropionicum DSM 5847]SFG76725.1 protein of unknown function [Clostridium homopropionicum]